MFNSTTGIGYLSREREMYNSTSDAWVSGNREIYVTVLVMHGLAGI